MKTTLVRASIDQCALVRRLFFDVVHPLDVYNSAAREAELALYTEARFREIIRDDPDYLWLAMLDDAPVGFSLVEPDGDLWWLAWFGVTPQGRGQRIGQKLVDNVLQVARSRRVPKVWCDTRAQNAQSMAVLSTLGFCKICDIPQHWYGEDYILWQVHT